MTRYEFDTDNPNLETLLTMWGYLPVETPEPDPVDMPVIAWPEVFAEARKSAPKGKSLESRAKRVLWNTAIDAAEEWLVRNPDTTIEPEVNWADSVDRVLEYVTPEPIMLWTIENSLTFYPRNLTVKQFFVDEGGIQFEGAPWGYNTKYLRSVIENYAELDRVFDGFGDRAQKVFEGDEFLGWVVFG